MVQAVTIANCLHVYVNCDVSIFVFVVNIENTNPFSLNINELNEFWKSVCWEVTLGDCDIEKDPFFQLLGTTYTKMRATNMHCTNKTIKTAPNA